MRPLGNRVLVKAEEEQQETASGIVLPGSFNGQVQKGSVIAVGRGAVAMSGEIIPMEVQEGDTVLFNKNQGIEIDSEGETAVLLHETDLFCIL